MDQQTLSEFKALLEAKKARLKEQLESVSVKSENGDGYEAEFPQYGDSMEDNASEVADYTKNLTFERDLSKEYEDVEKSLKKIEEGKYGICSHCEEEIEIERLRVRPESSSCVKCKMKLKGIA